MLTVHSHSELTIRRPNGAIEVARHPAELNNALFARIQSATKAAGCGDVLSYTLKTQPVPEPAGYAAGVAADRAYEAGRSAIYRAMDASNETDAADNTCAHPAD